MKPSIGRIVHVVIDSEGTHRPGVIVRAGIDDMIEVKVFYATDDNKLGDADNIDLCKHDETATARWSWHWPERVKE